jgi:hypothetical protein
VRGEKGRRKLKYSVHTTPARGRKVEFWTNAHEAHMLDTLAQGRAFGCQTSNGMVLREAAEQVLLASC